MSSQKIHNDNHLKLALDDARALVTPADAKRDPWTVSPEWAVKASHVGDLSVLALALRAA